MYKRNGLDKSFQQLVQVCLDFSSHNSKTEFVTPVSLLGVLTSEGILWTVQGCHNSPLKQHQDAWCNVLCSCSFFTKTQAATAARSWLLFFCPSFNPWFLRVQRVLCSIVLFVVFSRASVRSRTTGASAGSSFAPLLPFEGIFLGRS